MQFLLAQQRDQLAAVGAALLAQMQAPKPPPPEREEPAPAPAEPEPNPEPPPIAARAEEAEMPKRGLPAGNKPSETVIDMPGPDESEMVYPDLDVDEWARLINRKRQERSLGGGVEPSASPATAPQDNAAIAALQQQVAELTRALQQPAPMVHPGVATPPSQAYMPAPAERRIPANFPFQRVMGVPHRR